MLILRGYLVSGIGLSFSVELEQNCLACLAAYWLCNEAMHLISDKKGRARDAVSDK